MNAAEAARLIDHALLHPTLTLAEVRQGLIMAREAGCAAVCVRPCDAAFAVEILAGTSTAACAVIAFPHGAATPEAKAFEARQMVDLGVQELDMVLNNGLVHSGNWEGVRADIAAVVQAAQGKLVKVIFETDFQDEDQIIACCAASREAGAHFVKTSTGFGYVKGPQGYGYQGATAKHIQLMKTHAAPLKVKASGGIRSWGDLITMVEAGADRIGAGATEAILAGADGEGY